jgi:hypothetical protein
VKGVRDLGLLEENAGDIAERKAAGRADKMGNLVVVDDPPAGPRQRTECVNPQSEPQHGEYDEAEAQQQPTACHRATRRL